MATGIRDYLLRAENSFRAIPTRKDSIASSWQSKRRSRKQGRGTKQISPAMAPKGQDGAVYGSQTQADSPCLNGLPDQRKHRILSEIRSDSPLIPWSWHF